MSTIMILSEVSELYCGKQYDFIELWILQEDMNPKAHNEVI